jgi:UDP-N-acetylmuramoylalanine--D-glutamate ligase
MNPFADPASVARPGAGTTVLVVGLGASGSSAVRCLLDLGATVRVTDDFDAPALRERAAQLGISDVSFGGVRPEILRSADLVVVSPGVPGHAPILEAARERDVPVWSEVELGWRSAAVPVLGVTGTNGKTTTAEMLTAALTGAGFRAVAAGNIGRPLSEAAASDAEVIVAELSSFQLAHIVSFHSPVAILTNVAPDHLDWHGSFDAYAEAKTELFRRQRSGDCAVVRDDEICRRVGSAGAGRLVGFAVDGVPAKGAGVADGWIVVPEGRVVRTGALAAPGRAMLANAVAAAAAACAFGADPERAGAAIEAFRPGQHRMEVVAVVAGVEYVNDSKATNPHATLAAVEGMRGVVLIAGGRNKGLDLGALASAEGVKAVVAIGEAASEVEAAFRNVTVVHADSMDEAVERASALARAGDTVLLSPACASFDMFADYKARGEAFRAAVKRIEGTSNRGGSR